MDDAFEAFYRATCRRLIRFAYGLTGDSGVAQDLVQEAYARAWQRRGRLAGYEDAEAWLRLIVTRLATDRWRRLGETRPLPNGRRGRCGPEPAGRSARPSS